MTLRRVLIDVPLKEPVRNRPLIGHTADIVESTRLTQCGPWSIASSAVCGLASPAAVNLLIFRARLAANFWSVTLYEAESASSLANGQPFPSLGSRDMPASDADGGIDIYLSPRSPSGKQGNWLATVPGRGFFAILRLYGPTEAAINRTWRPGDFVRVR